MHEIRRERSRVWSRRHRVVGGVGLAAVPVSRTDERASERKNARETNAIRRRRQTLTGSGGQFTGNRRGAAAVAAAQTLFRSARPLRDDAPAQQPLRCAVERARKEEAVAALAATTRLLFTHLRAHVYALHVKT